MELEGYPGFSYIPLSKGKCRLFWRENRRQKNKTYKSRDLMMEAMKKLYPRFAASRVQSSEVVKIGVDLRAALDRMCAGIALNCAGNPESKREREARSNLLRLFDACEWKVLDDIDVVHISEYYSRDENRQRLGAVEGELRDLKQLFNFLMDDDIHVKASLRKFPIPDREEIDFRVQWTPEDKKHWWTTITDGIERLAVLDAGLSWPQRIEIACHTRDFERRMRFVAIYLLQSRYIYRPGESRRLKVKNWNSQEKILHLTSMNAKSGIEKFSYVDDEMAWLLDAWTMSSDSSRCIFLNRNNKPWKESGLYQTAKSLLKKAGLGDRMPYDYKYNVSPEMLGVDHLLDEALRSCKYTLLQDLMGHARGSAQTKRYDRFTKLVPTPAIVLPT